MPRSSSTGIQIQVRLTEIEPPIWRRIMVSSRTTLHELHRIIQLLFSWYDYHLYEFEIGDRHFQAPDADSEAEDSTRITLGVLGLNPGDVFIYAYDFGDDWAHCIEVERTNVPVDTNRLPCVLDGARRGPPEDCGGPHRYMQLLAALDRPLEDLNDEDRELVEWNGVRYDPEDFSLEQADHSLTLSAAWGVLKGRRR